MKKFNEYKGLNLPALSKEVLAKWEEENLFEKSISTKKKTCLRRVSAPVRDIRSSCSSKVPLRRTVCRVFTT